MSKQREEIHREVDNAFDQLELEIGEIKVKHLGILQKHLDEIKQLQSLMLQTLKALNEIEESNEKTIKSKSEKAPNDIAVDRDGAVLYTDSRTVYKVQNDQTEEIIMLQGWVPMNLCVISFGDLLVTMYSEDKTPSKVFRYSGSTVKQTIQLDEEGQPLYSGNHKIKYISENRNLDICVADSEAVAVVEVNQAGKFRFRYTGHSSSRKKNTFTPYGITTDGQSRILTSDCNNHCININDTDGQFLRFIDKCDLGDPYGLCLDGNDSLYVCEFYKGNVKKIRYSK
uniref:Uncharacterized protein LOC111124056 n=1 Tax=Crassostrea virginica TaxID=6565 RepID=A0A8B8D4L4_CRAVI|nr:uncharacterized protein LOC111124056 [Crassostrea virginica]